MDAQETEHILSQVGRLLDAEVIYQNRKCGMGLDDRLEKAKDDTIAFWQRRQRPHTTPPLNQWQPERTKMSITGAANLAGTIKDRINAAKAKVAQVSQNTDSALAKLNDAADTGDRIAKQIEAEADDLLAQIGQFSNGAPE